MEDKGAQLVVNIEAFASLVLACHRQGSADSLMPEANTGCLFDTGSYEIQYVGITTTQVQLQTSILPYLECIGMVPLYPALAEAEFAQAALELKSLCDGKLEGSSWQNVNWTGDELQIQQLKNEPSLASRIQDLDLEIDELEEIDLEAFSRVRSQPASSQTIHFSVILSPTYQVPVLWLILPAQGPASATALDRVYDVIVSPASRVGLRQIGVLGGISVANHPRSDVPAFFIHPCQTQEALNTVRPSDDISPLQYLLLWFGIIGSAVGLSVPANIMASATIQD